jgi:hypothetical protein
VGGRGPQLHRSPTRWHEEGAWGDCTERLVDRREDGTHSRRRLILLHTRRDGILHRLVLDATVAMNAGRSAAGATHSTRRRSRRGASAPSPGEPAPPRRCRSL